MTVTDPLFWVVVGVVVVVWVLLYLVACWRRPTAPCPVCSGSGFRFLRAYCPTCKGTGARRRWGARVLGR